MVAQAHPCRDWLILEGDPSRMVNRRIASLSGSFRFLREVAAELRLPIQAAKLAGQEFVGRANAEPVEERCQLSPAKAHRLLGLPEGETALAYDDRATRSGKRECIEAVRGDPLPPPGRSPLTTFS
jgi:hypothetical protein